ncbi:MAG TPA: GlsB/YeaQ/YmgE family stress response membrane protein [Steroidobacteraceae bacterium]|nr:GlsB/YeaQ/YmgE family stress response membrane protein [Steroidobacteraceae bacterium]
MLHFVWMFIVGIIIGFIARFIMGGEHMSLLMTGVLGIVGSFAGGLIARLFSKPPEGTPIHPAGIVMSIVGAVLVLFVWNRVVG